MTRKDYERLARALAESRPYPYKGAGGRALRDQWEATLIAIATELKADNPRFEAERFARAAHEGDVGYDSLEERDLVRKMTGGQTE